MFDGLAMGSNTSNCILVYEFCARYFESFIRLINIYQNYSEVSLLVLQFFDSFVKYQDFGKLSIEQSQILYKAMIELFKNYFAVNSGEFDILPPSASTPLPKYVSTCLEINVSPYV